MAKAIMVMGTMSSAGKSLITAGLCRIFAKDGYRTAPFKSQNMALNSFITGEGLEMGRAQVMQAEAAGIPPEVCMNPILLKPTSDMGSQVIVNGEVLGTMSARDYFRKKKSLVPEIEKAYASLDARFDILVIEGAGSPAEINLKQDDIVNMGMARMAKAPVLLVGDIDRGGVFAQLYGTIALLNEEERRMVKGLVINKFRGDQSILDPGIEMLKELTQKSVVGVVPYMDLALEDEDSVSARFEGEKSPALLDIAVVRLPRISNFTDFNPLEGIEGVSLRYVDRPSALKSPDLLILPGSKNTMGDLTWLRRSGFESLIKKHAARGGLLIGICGGYQMLGEQILDPEGAEEGGAMAGLGLLPVRTVFDRQKVRSRVRGVFGGISGPFEGLNGALTEGYEIHMGRSEGKGKACLSLVSMTDQTKKEDGCASGNVLGCYLHGLFEREETRSALLSLLAERKGVALDQSRPTYRSLKEREYDRLEALLRAHLDLERIYGILTEGL